MKNRSTILAIIILLLSIGSIHAKVKYELPKKNSRDQIVEHLAYTLAYSEEHEQAKWIAYELEAAELAKNFKRKDKFIPDPKVKTQSATNKDYSKSGYDRGHLAPAADMTWDKTAMAESFYFSNMSPQLPGFNRGIWKKLESQFRTWASNNVSVYVVTGPVLKPGLKKIGPNGVSVPEYYYKAMLVYTKNVKKAIGFIMPNKKLKDKMSNYAVSIDKIETVTGLDLFAALPNEIEKKLESSVNLKTWNFKEKFNKSASKKTSTGKEKDKKVKKKSKFEKMIDTTASRINILYEKAKSYLTK